MLLGCSGRKDEVLVTKLECRRKSNNDNDRFLSIENELLECRCQVGKTRFLRWQIRRLMVSGGRREEAFEKLFAWMSTFFCRQSGAESKLLISKKACQIECSCQIEWWDSSCSLEWEVRKYLDQAAVGS